MSEGDFNTLITIAYDAWRKKVRQPHQDLMWLAFVAGWRACGEKIIGEVKKI